MRFASNSGFGAGPMAHISPSMNAVAGRQIYTVLQQPGSANWTSVLFMVVAGAPTVIRIDSFPTGAMEKQVGT